MAHGAALDEDDARPARCRRSTPGPRRRPPRPRQTQKAHPRVHRGAEASPRRARSHPLLRRPARCGQDLSGAFHRPSDRPAIRSRRPGRRERRVGDPWTPPDVRGRLPWTHRDRPEESREPQPRHAPRRGRQAGERPPRRPRQRAPRGARSRAELRLLGPLHRPRRRPQPGDVHRDRKPQGHDPKPPSRPHGGDRSARLHAGREAFDRDLLPDPPTAGGARPLPRAPRVHRPRGRAYGRRLHERGGRSSPRATDRSRLPSRRGALRGR